MFAEYSNLDGLAIADLVRRREVTPIEVLEAAIARTDHLNPELNAIIHRMDDRARAVARRPLPDGPFAGVPFLVKDLIQYVAGEPYRAGSRALASFVPDHDTELVTRFRRAGLVLFGKTNTPEFGLTPFTEPVLFGPSRNPWDPDRTTGGSSGGSAAAVAAGLVPLAGGGDGGGSIRIPASCCGVFGLKPTRGRTPAGPDVGELWQGAVVDHALTRSVRDSAALLDATAGPDPGAPYFPPPPVRPYRDEVGADPGRLRIAVTTTPWLGKTVHPDCEAAVADASRLLTDLGHELVPASPAIDGPAYSRAFLVLICSELAADLAELPALTGTPVRRADFEPATWALGLLGQALRAEELSLARRVLGRVNRELGRFFAGYDALLTPTIAVPPWPIGALQPKPHERMLLSFLGALGSGRLIRAMDLLDQLAGQVFDAVPYTPPFNTSGQPAMSVPLHWNREGLPIGVQLVGRYADEATLFRLAGQLEAARPWKRPAVRR
jgi:amidase